MKRKRGASLEPYSEYSGTRNIGKWTKPLRGMQRIALSRAAGISIEPESVAT